MIGINYLFIEVIAYGFYRLKYGEYDAGNSQLERVTTINDIANGAVFTGTPADAKVNNHGRTFSKEILHPYLGYITEGTRVLEPCDKTSPAAARKCYQRIKSPADAPLPKRSADTLNVALLGGSVAVGTVNGSVPQAYERLLAGLPEYKGRRVIVHVMAAGGYRQPQPLMMLNYFYSLGAEYDIVISLDGFNDVAVAASEYKWNKIHPSFPRSWNHRIANTISADAINLQAKKINLESRHTGWARLMSKPVFRTSPLSNLLWRIKHSRYQAQSAQLSVDIAAAIGEGDQDAPPSFEKLGPDYDFSDWSNLVEYTAEIWARSNHLAHGVAEVQGAKFFHFIQPNQYIEGAKPLMNPQERSIAMGAANSGYGAWYKLGYPFLKQQQRWLEEQGVHTSDLTFLYKDIEGPIYIDNCCHVNSQGSYMIVEAIVDTIRQYNQTNEASTQ